MALFWRKPTSVVGSLVRPTTVSPEKLARLRDLNCGAKVQP